MRFRRSKELPGASVFHLPAPKHRPVSDPYPRNGRFVQPCDCGAQCKGPTPDAARSAFHEHCALVHAGELVEEEGE